MTYRYRSALPFMAGLLILLTRVALAAEFTPARVAVYFSPVVLQMCTLPFSMPC
jgi:hypothetical protein